MTQNLPVNLVFGGHSPIGIEISRALSKYGRTIHVSRSIDQVLATAFQGLDIECLELQKFKPEYIDRIHETLKSVRVKNVVFSHRVNLSENPSMSDFLTVEVFFPYEIIDFLVQNQLLVADSNIIFMTSPAAQQVLDDQPIGYHLSKASINQLVRYLSIKIGATTKVNAVAPGSFVLKKRNEEYFKRNHLYTSAISEFIPTGSIPRIEDLVAVIQFLISEKNKIINGQVIDLSGGYLNLETSHIFRKLFHMKNS